MLAGNERENKIETGRPVPTVQRKKKRKVRALESDDDDDVAGLQGTVPSQETPNDANMAAKVSAPRVAHPIANSQPKGEPVEDKDFDEEKEEGDDDDDLANLSEGELQRKI